MIIDVKQENVEIVVIVNENKPPTNEETCFAFQGLTLKRPSNI